MAEYTKKDVIIFADDSRASISIGKECCFSNSALHVIDYANNNIHRSKLIDLCYIGDSPFRDSNGVLYKFIIVKKEEPQEYVPFESAEEFIRAHINHRPENDDSNDSLMFFNGMWLKLKDDYVSVIYITNNGINDGCTFVEWKDLYKNYQFLDGSPCGMSKE